MNSFHCASPATPLSLLETVSRNHPASQEMICERYGRGLKFLLRRIVPDHRQQAFDNVVHQTIAAVCVQRIATEEDLCRFIRTAARDATATFPIAADVAVDPEAVAAIRSRLTIFTPLQLEALRRFYVGEEPAETICQELSLHSDQFKFLRTALKQLSQLALADWDSTR